MKFAHHSRPIHTSLARVPVLAVAVPGAVLAYALSAVGCACACKNAGQTPAVSAVNTAASDGSPGASPSGEAPSGPFAREMKTCPNGAIDDVEDNDTKVAATDGRGGYWYSYSDDIGSTVKPKPFVMTAGGAGGSKYAAHMSGKLAESGTIYAGMGLNFRDPKVPYNASFAKGISFRARAGAGGTSKIRVAVGDVNTDPAGNICKDKCYNEFGVDLTLTEKWQKYTIPFSAMTQEPYWGEPRPPSIDPSKVFGIGWKISGGGTVFDVWVDDVQFVCD